MIITSQFRDFFCGLDYLKLPEVTNLYNPQSLKNFTNDTCIVLLKL